MKVPDKMTRKQYDSLRKWVGMDRNHKYSKYEYHNIMRWAESYGANVIALLAEHGFLHDGQDPTRVIEQMIKNGK